MAGIQLQLQTAQPVSPSQCPSQGMTMTHTSQAQDTCARLGHLQLCSSSSGSSLPCIWLSLICKLALTSAMLEASATLERWRWLHAETLPLEL
jgi:hypothetical protein